MIGFLAGFAFFEGIALLFESGESGAIVGLHAKRGFGEKSAAARSDLVDRAGIINKKWALSVSDVVVVFRFVYFKYFANLLKKGSVSSVNFEVLFRFVDDFSCGQKILQRATDTAFSA